MQPPFACRTPRVVQPTTPHLPASPPGHRLGAVPRCAAAGHGGPAEPAGCSQRAGELLCTGSPVVAAPVGWPARANAAWLQCLPGCPAAVHKAQATAQAASIQTCCQTCFPAGGGGAAPGEMAAGGGAGGECAAAAHQLYRASVPFCLVASHVLGPTLCRCAELLLHHIVPCLAPTWFARPGATTPTC